LACLDFDHQQLIEIAFAMVVPFKPSKFGREAVANGNLM
jgi:hypothetical protein